MSVSGGHIPEHELLELVEGTLAAEREAVVRAALARDPRLGQLVARLRADRRGLMELGVAGGLRAPAGLAERVEAALEREALLGLEAQEAGSVDVIPVSGLRPRRAPVVARVWRSPVGRGVAMAAGLAVLVGGGYLAVTALSPGLPQGLPAEGTVASSDAAPVVRDDAWAPEPAMDIAAAEPEPAPEAIESGEVEGGVEVAMEVMGPPAPDAAVEAALAAAAARAPEGMSAERALELARRGKLAIVVRAADPAAAAAGVEALARASGRAGVWERVDAGGGGGGLARGYETIAALWSPGFGPAIDTSIPGAPAAPMVASGDGPFAVPPLGIGVSLPPGLPAWRPAMAAAPEAVWTVSVEDRAGTLTSLLGALGRESLGERAEFVELPVPIDAPPPAEADAVLWWAQPAGAWGWRVSVPVVVEGSPR